VVADDFVQQCVARYIADATTAYEERARTEADDAAADMERCESPLEEAFVRCWSIAQIGADYHLTLDAQMPIGNYRADLIIHSHFRDFPKIVIELDGHEFHEKTKEQVTYRNARDRYLQMAGWKVFHVSGSEFYRDPFGAVADVHDHAIEAARVCEAQRRRRRA
jgi:very-short-patch-repair endonuclease